MDDPGRVRNPGSSELVGQSSSETNVPLVSNGTKEHASHTSFNAYPLQYSTNLLSPENEVLFIPVAPTGLPFSIPPEPGQVGDPSAIDIHSHGQPVCHGFFFPKLGPSGSANPAAEDSPQNFTQSAMEAPRPPTGSSIPQGTVNQIQPNVIPPINQDQRGQIQLLLLQQLIALQLAQQASLKASTGANVPPVVPPGPPAATLTPQQANDISANGGVNPDMCTYIVPVEAKMQDDSGLALHITPRSQAINEPTASQGSGITLECPTERFVLYPYTQRNTATEYENSGSDEVFHSITSNGTAPTYTLDDLQQCIRRGSLDVGAEKNEDYLKSIRGSAKPGFVLLSVRHEKINHDDKCSYPSATQSISNEAQLAQSPVINTTLTEILEPKRPVISSQSPKRSGRKRNKLSRSESDARKRLLKRPPRHSMKSTPECETPVDSPALAGESETKAQTSISRFRVTRFADKRQMWLAPPESGCFLVKDLWTTKLPDYVLNRLKELSGEEFRSLPDEDLDPTGGLRIMCTYCESHQPKPCNCGGYMRS
ncbi:unnamed protein product [Calicophoron daubneyi]|uniref:Uncharacterized protein n=1 Tax=Calicophoron daubneyi TaxID=300641 RepID=A0AAV2TEI6_CALDB